MLTVNKLHNLDPATQQQYTAAGTITTDPAVSHDRDYVTHPWGQCNQLQNVILMSSAWQPSSTVVFHHSALSSIPFPDDTLPEKETQSSEYTRDILQQHIINDTHTVSQLSATVVQIHLNTR